MDPGLVGRCRIGDLDAFNALYEECSVKAFRTAYLITGRKETAEDAVQEAFVQCFLQIGRLRDPKAFESWFYRILTRISWRLCSRDGIAAVSIDDYLDHLPAGDYTAASVEECETRLAVHAALRKLSVPLRTAVVLHYFNGLTVSEIAGIMGCFPGTVKSRLHNARNLLMRELTLGSQDHRDVARLIRGECVCSARPRN